MTLDPPATPPRHPPLRLLYVCYLTLDDPLTHTQVVAYLAGLAKAGHSVHLLTFEPGLTRPRRRRWRRELRSLGIAWHGLRYHKRPSLPATIFDTLSASLCTAVWSRVYRFDVIHARTHVPAAMALLARATMRRPPLLVFDIRGLMVEEYEEAGRWRTGSLPSRVTRRVERAAISRAARIVILTNSARRSLFDSERRARVHVIPCCANLEQITALASRRDEVRRQLGLRDATVMIYVGKFPSWSMPMAMAGFFAAASELIEDLHFLILTQGDGEDIRGELRRAGAAAETYTISSTPPHEVGAYLAASDFAITFIRPAPSTVGQSPTKLGEYLGAGLPVVYSGGIGDVDDLMSSEVGVRVVEHSPESHRHAAAEILRLIDDPRTKATARSTAEQRLSLQHVGIPAYLELYEALASDLRSTAGHKQVVPTTILDSSK